MAATGGDKWVSPWGDDWRASTADTDKSRINRSFAVGLYPRGTAASGALDIAGREWCLHEVGNPRTSRHLGASTGQRLADPGTVWRKMCSSTTSAATISGTGT
jgi:hypothetical protein